MKKELFFTEIKDLLELDCDVNEATSIHFSSMEILSVIAFIDENFEKQVITNDLKGISNVMELMELIGVEAFK